MRKYARLVFVFVFVFLMIIANVYAADTKISSLTEASSANGTDLIPIVQSSTTKKIQVSNLLAIMDHGALIGLSDDDHTQYGLLDGRSGGQTLKGGTMSGDDLTLQSTSNATKGSLLFGTSIYDETNNWLGIGVTPLSVLHITDTSTANPHGLAIDQTNNAATAAAIYFRKTRAGAVLQDGDQIGSLYAYGWDGDSYMLTTSWQFVVDGTPADGSVPSKITFATTAAGQTVRSTKMTIEGDGDLLMASTKGSVGTETLCWDASGESYWGDCSASLRELKNNITDYRLGLNEILKLRVTEFDYKAEYGGTHEIGFIAEEVEEVSKSLVKYDNNSKLKDIANDRAFIGLLINAVKELKSEIDELKRECVK